MLLLPAWFRVAARHPSRRNGPGNHGYGADPRHRKSQYRGGASFLQGTRTGIERRASRQYIIYQQDAEVVNLQALARGVGATYGLPVFAAR
jgi:hypothetical protein